MKTLLRAGLLLLASCAALTAAGPTRAADWAVIVMYHRFGEDAYPATSIGLDQLKAHLEELAKPQYTVMAIPEIVARLKAGKPLPDHTVGLSIDDAYKSVYQNAWPLLKKSGFPFTLFAATDPIDRGGEGFMTWDQLRELHKAGVTIAEHTATHLHMATSDPARDLAELDKSKERFKAELGTVPTMIAYPYGEYSLAVKKVAQQAGFTTGFGQQSGVIYAGSDMMYLPRFAMNLHYGDISRFRLAINALPLRVKDVTPEDPLLTPANNPPNIGFTVLGDSVKGLARLTCYPSNQGKARIERLGTRVEIRLDNAFPTGRSRVNCTMLAPSGRWRWYGFQFLVPRS